MTRWLPARRVPPLVIDGLLAAFFTVLAQVELSLHWDDGYHDGPLWLNRPLQLLFTLPLALRTSRPRLTFCLMCAAIALPALFTARTVLFWGDMLPLMLVTFTIGRVRSDRWAWVAAPLATLAAGTVAIHNAEMPFSDMLFPLVMFGAATALGRLVGRLTEQRRQLADALAQLGREQARREDVAVQEERGRIAAEMHDVIAHAVSLMTIQIGAARLRLEITGREVPTELRDAETAGRRALAELRRTLGVMRRERTSGDLTPVPCLAGLPALVESFADAGLHPGLRVEVTGDLPASVQLAAYRIVQESLTNVTRHAGPVDADVRLVRTDDELTVSVRNASGSVASDRRDSCGGGHGLAGMNERVAMFGGSLATEYAADGGFSVFARIPLPPNGAHQLRSRAAT